MTPEGAQQRWRESHAGPGPCEHGKPDQGEGCPECDPLQARVNEITEANTEEEIQAAGSTGYPAVCPTCRGTGGGVYNDCPTCDGNGEV